MPKAARITDLCDHKVTVIITGSPDTIIGWRLAARVEDLTSPCPICKMIKPGKIVRGSRTVFINKKSAARVSDPVMCGAGMPPPPLGGSHPAVKEYKVRKEDNVIETIFADDKFLITETATSAGDPEPDKPPPREKKKFFEGLSLNIDLGRRAGNAAFGFGLNSVSMGDSTVYIGG
jgi:uncharacterized Zn-binding protein involved in type VI secretion